MSFASDQDSNDDRLSPNAKRMLALREDILREWSARLRATVKEAANLPQPILINTFPSLYDNLVQAISPGYPRMTAGEGSTVASEHGGERARLTNYNARSVIAEYQVLRWSIFDVLKRNGIWLEAEEFSIINTSLDESIRDSVTAFALAQSALRERFVAALTHDLRNPLATATFAVELIRRATDLKQAKEYAERIASHLGRMDVMIQELLDTVVFQQGERLRLRLEEFDVFELVQQICSQFAGVHGARFECEGSEVVVWWDRDTIQRAIENLMGNGVKYGAAGAPIRITVDASHERVMLRIHNRGEPIPPEQLEGIFQIYERAAAAKAGDRKGWGIGLPYVRSVAESHGGSVEVDSAPERGTTFLFDLPADARPFQDAPILTQDPDAASAAATGKPQP